MPYQYTPLTQGQYAPFRTLNSADYKALQSPIIDVLSDKATKKMFNFMTGGIIPNDSDVSKLGDKSRIITRLYGGSMPLGLRPEGGPIPLGSIPTGPEKMTSFSEYALKLQFTDTAIDDDKNVNLKTKALEALHRGVIVTQNYQFAQLFDTGFDATSPTYKCADGKNLYSTEHSSIKNQEVRSNYIKNGGADIALDAGDANTGLALQLATIYMAKYRDMSGMPCPIGTDKLILLVSPDLYPAARKLVGENIVSSYKPQTPAQGTPQFLISNGRWEVVQCPWFEKPNSYHVISPSDLDDLSFFIRQAPKVNESWDTDGTMWSINIRARWALNLVDWKGTLGGKSAA